MKKFRLPFVAVLCAAVILFTTACSSTPATSGGASGSDGAGKVGVGFIFIGTKDDYGYNQAAYKGSLAVEEQLGDQVTVYRQENIPETSEATRALEQMIQQGATILFPTSYGHLDPALVAAEDNPDCIFFHQGGLKNSENLGTYFGTIWESFYLCGIAAGMSTESNQLGFVASFPIPQVLLNINAFELGAKSVNPDATTTVVFTGSWSDPAAGTNAANSLIAGGADVIAQHQDSTKTIIGVCESSGVKCVGIHADASELAPNGWITGAVWNWDDLFVDMTKTALAGEFSGSQYDGKYRGGLKEGVVDIAPFGENVSQEIQDVVNVAKEKIIAGELFAFEGEIKDQNGSVRIEAGVRPSVDELETCDYLVEGCIGSVSQ